jgi:hypothetical protein
MYMYGMALRTEGLYPQCWTNQKTDATGLARHPAAEADYSSVVKEVAEIYTPNVVQLTRALEIPRCLQMLIFIEIGRCTTWHIPSPIH